MESFGDRLLVSRKGAGLKQANAAKCLQITPVTLSRYETNQREPSFDMCIKMSELYNVDVHWLLTGEKPKETVSLEITEDEKKLLDYYRQATDFEKGMIWGIIKKSPRE